MLFIKIPQVIIIRVDLNYGYNGALILATFGDDSSTPEIDGLTADEIVTFIATTQSGISYWIYPYPLSNQR